MTKKLVKLITILTRPALWRSLLRGTAAAVEHIDALRHVNLATCLDVGANVGQFSALVRYVFPSAAIVAFEPLPEAADRYARVMKGADAKLHRVALATASGMRNLHVTNRADSSSLLAPGEEQTRAFAIYEIGTESVPVAPLVSLVRAQDCRRPMLLKIDVQGGELDVLKGCGELLDAIDWIYVELSYVQLYSGQPLAGEVVCFLVERGFELRGIFNQAQTKTYGATQADFLFSRRPTAQV